MYNGDGWGIKYRIIIVSICSIVCACYLCECNCSGKAGKAEGNDEDERIKHDLVLVRELSVGYIPLFLHHTHDDCCIYRLRSTNVHSNVIPHLGGYSYRMG